MRATDKMVDAAIQSMWVSIKNDIPRLNQEVIVRLDDGKITNDIFASDLNGGFAFEGYPGYDGDTGVTHWMPLPEFKGA